jgi:hypothetical protein
MNISLTSRFIWLATFATRLGCACKEQQQQQQWGGKAS